MSPRSTAAPAGARLVVATRGTIPLRRNGCVPPSGRLASSARRYDSVSSVTTDYCVDAQVPHGPLVGPRRSEPHDMPETAVVESYTGGSLKALAERHGLAAAGALP